MSEASSGQHNGTLAATVGLILIAILSLGFVGYASLNPQVMTVTEQRLLTNTENHYFTQTVTGANTITTLSTLTTLMVSTNEVNNVVGPGLPYYSCGAYGCSSPSLGAYGSLCQTTTQNGTVNCSGYLSEPGDGCVQLAIPYTNPYILESIAYQVYTLRNLSSTVPPAGSWIAVTGQLGYGYTPGSNGATCPVNYIDVSTVSE